MATLRRVFWLAAIVIVITGISALVFWQPRPPGSVQQSAVQTVKVDEGAPSAGPLPVVRTAPVARRDLSVSIRAHGTLQASRDLVVAPKISAPVAAVLARAGDDVEEGDVLLRLDRSELEIRRQQAAASLSAAESNLARLLAGARPEELEQVQAQVEQAAASLKQVTDELARIESLYRSGAATLSQLEQVRTQAQVAEAQHAAAVSQLNLVRQGARAEDVEAARAQVEQARSGVALAELQLSYADVASPIGGRVISRHIDEGEFAQAGAPVFRIMQLDPIVVRAQVGARDIVRIRRGAEALLRLDALPGETFRGSVSLVESAADDMTRLFGVEVSVPNPGGRLLPGMPGEVEIVIVAAPGALAVPQSAVLSAGGEPYVYVADGSVARRRAIETGISAGEWIEVKSGLAEGERVVTSGLERLEDGAAISAVQGSASP